jgi:hypothetical protein
MKKIEADNQEVEYYNAFTVCSSVVSVSFLLSIFYAE